MTFIVSGADTSLAESLLVHQGELIRLFSIHGGCDHNPHNIGVEIISGIVGSEQLTEGRIPSFLLLKCGVITGDLNVVYKARMNFEGDDKVHLRSRNFDASTTDHFFEITVLKGDNSRAQ